MSEHPILFNGEMVRAILDGRKTQTRRVIKPQPACLTNSGRCPYGVPGDRLWVRETFCLESADGIGLAGVPPFADGRPVRHDSDPDGCPWWEQPHYRATDPPPQLTIENAAGELVPGCKWKPSIHMPRWASRITLQVTDVRVERVQETSEHDAMDEGVLPCGHDGFHADQHTCAFAALWDSINTKRGFGWDTNPWVFVVQFERTHQETSL